MIRLVVAKPEDAAKLASIQQEAFDRECKQYGREAVGGPTGYADEEWQKSMMAEGHYFIISEVKEAVGAQTDSIIGGAIVFPDRERLSCHVGRIFLHPDKQNHGYGLTAMLALEHEFPWAVRWDLDTPDWELKNHRFYLRCGYQKIRETNGFYYYEKRIESSI
ncbi:GNAT family N-acetyltransferase [Gorillibacterium timonense]|uniref:GNAT family N-acetyltransferase n=1 Tax=Gorillibacterium timonense TaxID=1689269 RepID=UPI00071D6AFF|nr:GNAT family N-acetyltransferase [Gorillibacterium timonense]